METLTCNRDGILDNVKRDRDSVFEDQHIHDQIILIISALLSEMSQTDPANDAKEGE